MKEFDLQLRVRGLFRLLILYILKNGPLHGYGIANEFEKLFNHAYRPSPGILYPTLRTLERKGLITSWKEGRRKLYKLTERGVIEINKFEEEIRNFIERFKGAYNISKRIGLNLLLKTIWRIANSEIEPEILEEAKKHISFVRNLLKRYEKEE